MSLPSRRQHWTNKRLRTKLRAGEYRPHYQQFDYSPSDTDDEPYGAMIPIPTYPQDLEQPTWPPDPPVESVPHNPVSDVSFQDCLPQLFSDHELERSTLPKGGGGDLARKHRCLVNGKARLETLKKT